MTASAYGFWSTNDSGEWLVNQDTVTPMLYTKGSFGSAADLGTTPSGLNWYQHAVSYTSGTPTGELLVFMTLPSSSSAVWFQFDGASLNVFCVAGTGYTLPELYFFTLQNHATPSGSYGLQVFKPDGSVAFDSRLLPMAITTAPSGASFTNGSATSLAMGTLPTKPAFLIPAYEFEQWARIGSTSESDVTHYLGTARRDGSTLYLLALNDGNTVELAILTGSYSYGLSSGLAVPVINAALYD